MALQRVQLHQSARGVQVETEATIGAVVGVNLVLQDGTIVTAEMLGIGADSPDDDFPSTYWRLILEVPPNVVALAETDTTGIYVITGAGTSATREIEGTVGRTTVGNGDAVAGNPTVDLAVLLDSGLGDLVGLMRDAWGRVSGTRPVEAGDNVVIDTTDPDRIIISSTGGGGSEILVESGSSAPPIMLTNTAEDDFVYSS